MSGFSLSSLLERLFGKRYFLAPPGYDPTVDPQPDELKAQSNGGAGGLGRWLLIALMTAGLIGVGYFSYWKMTAGAAEAAAEPSPTAGAAGLGGLGLDAEPTRRPSGTAPTWPTVGVVSVTPNPEKNLDGATNTPVVFPTQPGGPIGPTTTQPPYAPTVAKPPSGGGSGGGGGPVTLPTYTPYPTYTPFPTRAAASPTATYIPSSTASPTPTATQTQPPPVATCTPRQTQTATEPPSPTPTETPTEPATATSTLEVVIDPAPATETPTDSPEPASGATWAGSWSVYLPFIGLDSGGCVEDV